MGEMKLKKKLRNKNGSAMTLAIVTLLIVGICGTTVTSMVTNQIKSTKNNYDSIDSNYQAEAQVETLVADYIDQIEVKGERGVNLNYDLLIWYFMIAHRYTEVAETYTKYYHTEYSSSVISKLKNGELENPYPNVYTLLGDNGHIGKFEEELETYIASNCECFDTCKGKDCSSCKNINNNNNKPNNNNNKCNSEKIRTLTLEDLELIDTRFKQISNLLELTLNDNNYNDKSRSIMELKQVMEVCRQYLKLITDNVKDSSEGLKFSNFTLQECNMFISGTLNNISKTEYSYFENDNKNYGSIGILYRNICTLYDLTTTHRCGGNKYHIVCELDEDMVVDTVNNKYGQLTKDIEAFLNTTNTDNTQTKLKQIITKIDNYSNDLDFNVENNSSGFRRLYKFYAPESKTNGDKWWNDGYNSPNQGGGNHNIVTQLKTGIEYELKFLSYLLGIYNNLEYGGSGDSGVKSSFTIEIPKKIDEYVQVDELLLEKNCLEANIGLDKTSKIDKYILKINQASLNSYKAVFNIDVNASVEESNIKSTVGLIISPAMGEDVYNVNYEVKSWNKVS